MAEIQDKNLEFIEKYELLFEADHKKQFMEFVTNLWNKDFGNITETFDMNENEMQYEFITGGWSENEAIITALRTNFIFWSMFWFMSERGGKHIFKIPF